MGIWTITRKELLLLMRDLRAFVTLLIFPLVFILIIGASTGELLTGDSDNQKVQLGLVVEAVEPVAAQLGDVVARQDGFIVTRYDDQETAVASIAEGDNRMVMIIGEEFDARVEELKPSDLLNPQGGRLGGNLDSLGIELEGRPAIDQLLPLIREVLYALTIQTITPEIAKKNNRIKATLRAAENRRRRELREAGKSEEEIEAIIAGKPETGSESTTAPDTTTRPGGVYQEIVPGYTVLFVFFMINIMARSFIQEREIGTFRRLLLAPIAPLSLFLGKTIPFLLLSLAQTALLFGAGRLLFGMNWGTQPWVLLPVMLATSLAATGLGLLIAAMVRTDSQVSAYATFLVIVMGGISGCFIPRDWLPEALRTLSLVTPQAWSLIAYNELLNTEAPDLQIVWQACGVLLLFGVVFIAVGTWVFRPDE